MSDKKPLGTLFRHEKDSPASLRGDLKGRGRELAVFEAEALPSPQAPGLSAWGGRDSLTGCSQPLVLSRSLGLPSVDIINLFGAPAQNWTSLFQMTAQLAWGSVVSRLTWWLWVPALSPPWAAAYPAEADLDLDHSGNRPVYV